MATSPDVMSQQLQALVDLIVAPNQTQEQRNRGELSFAQTVEALKRVTTELEGPSGGLSYERVRDFVQTHGPSIPKLESAADELKSQVLHVQKTLDPILQTADACLRETTEY